MSTWIKLAVVSFASSCYGADFTFCIEDQSYPPYQIGPEEWEDERPGLLVDLIALTGEASGNTTEFVHRPWKRCQQELKLGNIDGVIAFIYTEERDQWAAFPKTGDQPDQRYSFLGEYQIFIHKDSQLNWDGERFNAASAQVQSIPGYVADQKLRAMNIVPKVELQPAKGLEMVARERIDGYVIDRLIGWEVARTLEVATQLKTIETPFLSQAWYVAFSMAAYERSPEDIERFWSMLATVRNQHGPSLEEKYLNRP